MIKPLTKYVTPLRLMGVWFLIWAIIEYIDIEKSISEGHEPGLGGLGFMALGSFSLLFLLFDLILSLTIKQKKNWIIQLIIIALFFIWILIVELKK